MPYNTLTVLGTRCRKKKSEFVLLLETALEVLAIIAVSDGIGLIANQNGLIGADAWNEHYSSWGAAKGIG